MIYIYIYTEDMLHKQIYIYIYRYITYNFCTYVYTYTLYLLFGIYHSIVDVVFFPNTELNIPNL